MQYLHLKCGCMCVCARGLVYVCMSVCICVHMHIYIYKNIYRLSVHKAKVFPDRKLLEHQHDATNGTSHTVNFLFH